MSESELPLLAAVAVFAPLRQAFDYEVPEALAEKVRAGTRVAVTFGPRARCGIVISTRRATPDRELRPIDAVLEPNPVLPEAVLELCLWAARYYQHPLGEVCAAALPAALRGLEEPAPPVQRAWELTDSGREASGRGARQVALLAALRDGAIPDDWLVDFPFDARAALRRLADKGWVSACERPPSAPWVAKAQHELAPEQAAAAAAIGADGEPPVTLLEGVTGSGKTEVYLEVIAARVAEGRQALMLVPEIGLTHALIERFRQRFGDGVGIYHSGLSDGPRHALWCRVRSGEVAVVLGTRSALWLPFRDLALIAVDEEHDESFKQQEGFRYSARDVAVMRGHLAKVPVILGSATPSLETLANVERGRYGHRRLTRRAGGATPPAVRLVDVRGEKTPDAVGSRLAQAIEAVTARGEQALIYVNRRGFAPTVLCESCGTPVECRQCSAPMVWHQKRRLLMCHHCGLARTLGPVCECGPAFEPVFLGSGTERVTDALKERFPALRIERVDRDTAGSEARRGALLGAIERGEVDVAVGTRMLAKGHHFPKVTLVGILEADARLFSPDFRAPERLAQVLVQVAGRAGRAEAPGEVLIQTRMPEHPLFGTLLSSGYPVAAREMLELRRRTGLPPFRMLVLLRADAKVESLALEFLGRVPAALAERFTALGVEPPLCLGPFSAPLVRKAGYYRAQLLLTLGREGGVLGRLDAITDTLQGLDAPRSIRWSVDVDPLEMG